ncbi:uncharacterized protein LOC112088099 [Eutrema salsugineum]|uniref:uncharacterized protein LOC112088099 n=1 Tax=Eutrema salsugineum TaxID=72664 RepID=UPI000CED05FB|nr:uncharacterized protein LOC112088099 [Eutrema salsugineum]
MHNRIATGDRILQWNANADATCPLCQHLFFACEYSRLVWEPLAKDILKEKYTTDWDQNLSILKSRAFSGIAQFFIRYTFHATIYGLWRERNAIKHGETPSPRQRLVKVIDKAVRNRLSTIRLKGGRDYENGLVYWFDTRA